MKNTLIAVLIMCLYCDHTQAQNTPPHAADYTSTIMADGVITTDKLADDIVNLLKEMEAAPGVNKQAQGVIPVPIQLNNTIAIDQYAYVWHRQYLLPYAQPLHKPRPIYNRIGWLRY